MVSDSVLKLAENEGSKRNICEADIELEGSDQMTEGVDVQGGSSTRDEEDEKDSEQKLKWLE
jgi:hypothetical protein